MQDWKVVEISLLTDTFLNCNVSFSGLDSCSQLMFSHGLLLYLSGKSFFPRKGPCLRRVWGTSLDWPFKLKLTYWVEIQITPSCIVVTGPYLGPWHIVFCCCLMEFNPISKFCCIKMGKMMWCSMVVKSKGFVVQVLLLQLNSSVTLSILLSLSKLLFSH